MKFPHERDWSLYFRKVSWDFKLASGKESASLKVITKRKGKTNKKLTRTDQETDVFTKVIQSIEEVITPLGGYDAEMFGVKEVVKRKDI